MNSDNFRAGPARVARINPLEDSDWDRKLAAFSEASCFHTTGWARVLHDTYGYQPCCFATTRGDGFGSVFPVMSVSSPFTGKRGVALPFTDCCEPLCAPGENEHPLIESAIRHAEDQSWRYIEFRGCGEIPMSAPATVRYFTHQLCMKPGENAVWSGLNDAARRSIRKARDESLVISTGRDQAALKEFFRLHCLTRKRLGVPPQSFEFFSNIRRHLLDHHLATLFLASYRGKCVAAAIFFHFGSKVMFKFGASDLAFQHLRPNNLLMWEAIRHFIAEGSHSLHMGRNEMDNPGLRRYKLGWGTAESQLAYHRYAPAHKAFVGGCNPQQGWQRFAFRHIPVPLSRVIGSLLYPHMA